MPKRGWRMVEARPTQTVFVNSIDGTKKSFSHMGWTERFSGLKLHVLIAVNVFIYFNINRHVVDDMAALHLLLRPPIKPRSCPLGWSSALSAPLTRGDGSQCQLREHADPALALRP